MSAMRAASAAFVDHAQQPLDARPKNPRFWHMPKPPRLTLPQTPFKTYAVGEGFWTLPLEPFPKAFARCGPLIC